MSGLRKHNVLSSSRVRVFFIFFGAAAQEENVVPLKIAETGGF